MQPVLPRPADATLTVTKAARVLGVHPNTIRAWSNAGRVRYYRINERGDRRYRLVDLQRFLAASLVEGPDGTPGEPAAHPRRPSGTGISLVPINRQWGGGGQPPLVEAELVAGMSELVAAAARPGTDIQQLLDQAARQLCAAGGFRSVGIRQRRGRRLVTRSLALGGTDDRGPLGGHGGAPARPRYREHAPIAGRDGQWGVLEVHRDPRRSGSDQGEPGPLVGAVARAIAAILAAGEVAAVGDRRVRQSEALRRAVADLGGLLRVEDVLAALVEHAADLLGANRVGVVLRDPPDSAGPEVIRRLRSPCIRALRDLTPGSLVAAAASGGRVVATVIASDGSHPPSGRAHAPAPSGGIACAAPLLDGTTLLGVVELHRDGDRPWTEHDLTAMSALAEQAAIAIRTAQDHRRMMAWAAQLQSIQQLGVRLNGLRTVGQIAQAIATELRQLIDYQNVRVYRLYGTDLVPVAMQGHIGEYHDETPEQLRVRLGEGITGWVAEHRQAVRLGDAARDPRARTIPGTARDLEESLLVAPLIFEDEVLGVLVLAKLGVHQFRDDHLRLLVIYASLAAQAMANADATERLAEQSAALERQLRSQRELLSITESILSTLDPAAVLEQIAERLGSLVDYDTITIEQLDPASGLLVPLVARGARAEQRMAPWTSGEPGLARWVLDQNTPALVLSADHDPRVSPMRDAASGDSSSIAVPLRGRNGATGVLTLERPGAPNSFSYDEFELVQLFAAQVSIALQNAEVHRAVQIRAQTDDLTGLLNHGTFIGHLTGAVEQGTAFSLLMLDLDHFKRVNDALGHQAGDDLLAEIARALEAATREEDHVFRYGGDEFTILLAETGAARVGAAAERIRCALEAVGARESRWHDGGLRVSASIGIASYPDDGRSASAVLLAADRACFAAKRSGRSRIATAREGLALAGEASLQAPTPVDPPTGSAPVTAGGAAVTMVTRS